MRSLYILPLGAALAAWAVPTLAAACTPLPALSFDVQADPSDTRPPGAATYELGPIDRGDPTGDSAMCSDLGTFAIHVTPPAGENPDDVGYRLAVESGTLPDRFVLPPVDMALFSGVLPFYWIDGICLEQEAFDFVLRVAPIDRAGNEGPAERIRVSDPGRAHGEGCADPGAGGAGGSAEQGGAGGPPDDPVHIDPDSGCSAGGAGASSLAVAFAALLLGRQKRSS